jgi:Carboxypeptidase regulatory-like domain
MMQKTWRLISDNLAEISRIRQIRFAYRTMIVICLLAASSFAKAQLTGQGTISGTVTDTSGAVIAGAHVTITNVETGVARSTDTNGTGYFEADNLNPGIYNITAGYAGFEDLKRQGITLEATARLDIPIVLKPGASNSTITVTADASLLNVESGSNGQVLTTRQVENLPVAGNDTTYLNFLAPGVQANTSVSQNQTDTVGSNAVTKDFGTYGQIGINEFSLDGAPNMQGRAAAINIPPDYLGEEKYDVSGFDATVGHTMGVAVTQTTKLGTNELHGSFRDTYTAKRWAAMGHFQGLTYRYEQSLNGCVNGAETSPACLALDDKYGWPGVFMNNGAATLSGPVYIPKIYNGHNRFFFFVSVMDTNNTSATAQTVSIPTVQERLGNFNDFPTTTPPAGFIAGTTGADGVQGTCPTGTPYYGQYQIYDPFSVALDSNGIPRRNPICGNVLPAGRMTNSAMVQLYNSLLPVPTAGGATGSNYLYSQKVPVTYRDYTTREDYKLSDKNSIFARYTRADYTNTTMGFTVGDADRNSGPRWVDVAAVGWTHIFSNSTSIDSAVGMVNYKSACCYYPGFDPYSPSSIGLPSYANSYAKGTGAPGVELPVFSVSNYNNIGNTDNSSSLTRAFAFRSSLIHVAGHHTIRVGGEYRLQDASAGPQGNVSGTYTFNNTYDQENNGSDNTYTQNNWGLSYAAFLMGVQSSASVGYTAPYSIQSPYYAICGEDTWRLTPKLTIIPGIRYEFEYGVVEKHNALLNGWNPSANMTAISQPANAAYAATVASAPAAAQAVLPTSLAISGGVQYANVNGAPRNEWNNNYRFLPRVAVAYQVDLKTVIRGGYGMFFDTLNALTPEVNQSGFSTSTSANSSTTFGTNFVPGNSPLVTDPFPANGAGARFNTPIGASAEQYYYVGSSATLYDHNLTPARQQRASIGVQRQVGASTMMEATYAIAYTSHLQFSNNLSYTPSSFYAGGEQPNTAPNQVLNTQVTNPFALANYSSFAGANPAEYNLMSLNNFFTQAKTSVGSLVRAYPQMSGLTINQALAQSHFQQVVVSVTHRYSSGLTMVGSTQFNFQDDRDYRANGFDPQLSWEPSNSSLPVRVTFEGDWNLPFGRGQHWANSGWQSALFGGFKLNGAYEAQNGLLVNFGNLFYVGNISASAIKIKHPIYVNNLASGGSLYVQWLNPGNVAATASVNSSTGATTCTYTGTGFVTNSLCQPTGYNLRVFPTRVSGVRQMGLNNADADVTRDFHIVERLNFETMFSVYNLFNHEDLAAPSTSVTSNQFGWVTSDGSPGSVGRWVVIQGRFKF